jgi:serine phosphatase RsbU (regulator of sigma subunit)
MNAIKNRFPNLFKEIDPMRYTLTIRGNILVFAGYCIATIETFIAIKCGFTPITYADTALISATVLIFTILVTTAVYFQKRFLLWHEWLMFLSHLFVYAVTFCIWVYTLQELRIIGLLLSSTTLICYFAVVYYSIVIHKQPGSLYRELFLTLCLIPAFMLIAVVSDYLNKKNEELGEAKSRLEFLNENLVETNSRLEHEQKLSRIEMDLAHDIQRALFPLAPPVTEDWDIAFMSKPKSGVSGDFYDFYHRNKKLQGISLFDVSGHGVASALITILAKPVIFRNFNSLSEERPGQILKASHEDLLDQLEEVNIYITGILLRMHNNFIEYVNAGHPDILHKEYSTGKVRAITDKDGNFKGGPLGIGSLKLKYDTLKFPVEEKDFIVIYSDGLTETRNSKGLAYGSGRLMETIKNIEKTDAAEILKAILTDYNRFRGSEPANDDYTIIVARKK